MSLSKKEFASYIKQFNFKELFIDMGWNNDKTSQPIVVDGVTYTLQAIAVKSGFKILACLPHEKGQLPDFNTRKKIENKVTKLFQEHLIIFYDAAKTEQIWQLVVRQSGKPTKVTETRYNVSQDPELLFQRTSGIFFELDEEDKITIVDVKNRVSENFQQNNEKVTKAFYEKFKKEHTSFLKFIKGIEETINQEWYASLMLNRLMFCYFIQKKGFLDNDKNYLRNKLKACKSKKDKFYSFYRDFLLVLFHKGLNEPLQHKDVKIEIGKIPYLNGGLFDEHELEKNHKGIDIDDKAFERLFDFFDEYEWHLDTRITATGKDINPDVIGYIFEKYINDRADMGAYYTKEDITDYISKNCIIPYLFDETKRQYPKAFEPAGIVWELVKNSGDTYIYDAVKHGTELVLPTEIESGKNDVSKRAEWNKPAVNGYGLPTEIWREVVDRRNRYAEVKTKIETGQITTINDFITYNLNIRQFAQDAVYNTNDADWLKAFYKALSTVTIIDPTCGSGAFLFAAMNILEPLYETCIQRMENFVAEGTKGKYKFFEEVLAQVNSIEHPNLPYFIYKTIILRNLYGVDIMKEAVEIAKLRLFLKLVATVEADFRKPNLGLEPLPDIDFNIRAGNTLVGFATYEEVEKGGKYTLDFDDKMPQIEEKCEIVAKAFSRYKEIQLSTGDDFKQFKKAKDELNNRLKELNHNLNQLLFKQITAIPYDKWLKTHQPFHWFAEFYEIVKVDGGFNVIIGNPPYVEYKDVKDTYTIKDFKSAEASDLYAFVMERSLNLSNEASRIGFIIPMSCFTVDGFSSIQNLYFKSNSSIFISNWSGDAHPSKLFEGVDKRLHILLSERSKIGKISNCNTFINQYTKWYSGERPCLFDTRANYYLLEDSKIKVFDSSIPKISSKLEENILNKLKRNKPISLLQSRIVTKNTIYYTRKVSFFLQFLDFIPIVKGPKGERREPSELKALHFQNEHIKNVALASLCSSTFYWYYIINSDCRNLNKREIAQFYVPEIPESENKIFKETLLRLMNDYNSNSALRTVFYKNKGEITVQYFNVRLSKSIINEIDTLLAKHYGFTDEELDFIINYDIKYRMGKELEEEIEA